MKKHLCAPATPTRSSLADLWADERGTTAIEYGLIVALIVVVVIVGMQAVGDAITVNFYNKLSTIFAGR